MIQRSPAELAGAMDRIRAMRLRSDIALTAAVHLQEMQGAAIQVQSGEPIGVLTASQRRTAAYAAGLQAPACDQLAELFKDQAASFRRRLGR